MTENIEVRVARLEEKTQNTIEKLDAVHRSLKDDIAEIKQMLIKQSCDKDKCDDKFVSKAEVRLGWLILVSVAAFFGYKL